MPELALGSLLRQFAAIAKAPMAASAQCSRAQYLLESSGFRLEDLTTNVARTAFPWNNEKAREQGVYPKTWLHAVCAVGLPQSRSMAQFLERLRQAEAAAALLKAGYMVSHDDSAKLVWLTPR